MSRRVFLSTALAGTLAMAAIGGALFHERLLDALYAARTGYYFEWMPEGVIPADRPINKAGQVAVNLQERWPDSPDSKAGLWSIRDSRVRLLGTLPSGPACSAAFAIGEDGSVVGTLNEESGAAPLLRGMFIRGFVWSESAGMIEVPNPGGGQIFCSGINRKSEVVGTSVGKLGTRGFRWTRDTGTEILATSPSSKDTFANGINDAGWIAGNAVFTSGMTIPVLWVPGRPVRDLGLPPGYSKGYASKINARGEILASLVPQGNPQAYASFEPFLWSEERGYVALPRPEGYKKILEIDLNDLGQVLLRGERASDGASTAFLVTNGQWKSLPPARIGLSTVYSALNDRGWLAGYVELVQRGSPNRRGFVARP